MSEIELLLMEKLAAKATPADTDTMIVAEGNVLKKSTISQLVTFLKEKLGINSLNTKLNNYVIIKSFVKLIALSNGRGSADFSNSDIAITGYTPLGIVQCSFATTWFVPTRAYIDSSGAHIGVERCRKPYRIHRQRKLLHNNFIREKQLNFYELQNVKHSTSRMTS